MHRVLIAISHLVRRIEGQDLLEYAMLAALVSAAAIIAVRSVGMTVNSVLWQAIAESNV